MKFPKSFGIDLLIQRREDLLSVTQYGLSHSKSLLHPIIYINNVLWTPDVNVAPAARRHALKFFAVLFEKRWRCRQNYGNSQERGRNGSIGVNVNSVVFNLQI